MWDRARPPRYQSFLATSVISRNRHEKSSSQDGLPTPIPLPKACLVGGESHLEAIFPLNKSWDGLGHVGLSIAQHISAGARSSPSPAHFFDEDWTPSSIYFRNVAGLAHDYNASIYCHRGPTNWSLHVEKGEGQLAHDFRCLRMPPLEEWFNFFIPDVRVVPAPTVADMYAEAGDRHDMGISCGHTRGVNPMELSIALHFRLGDLVGKPCSRAARCDSTVQNPMVGGAHFVIKNALQILSQLTVVQTRHKLHVTVISDSPLDVINSILKPLGIGMRQITVIRQGIVDIVIAITEGLSPVELKLHVISGGNPLVGLHCLGTAQVVLGVFDASRGHSYGSTRSSNFMLLAKMLSKGAFFSIPSDPALGSDPRRISQEVTKLTMALSAPKANSAKRTVNSEHTAVHSEQ